MDIQFIFGILGAVMTVASFFMGKISGAKQEGKTLGEIKTSLIHLEKSVIALNAQGKVLTAVVTELAVTRRDVKTVFKQIEAQKEEDKLLRILLNNLTKEIQSLKEEVIKLKEKFRL